MTTYTLVVTVGENQMQSLVSGGYNLCISKVVSYPGRGKQSHNVVWVGGDFLESNTFQWTEQYQVYGAENFSSGALIQAETNVQNIQFGQSCTLDSVRVLHPTTGTLLT